MVRHLNKEGYAPIWKRVDTAGQLKIALRNEPWDIITSDYSMPLLSVGEALAILQHEGLDIPFIVISGTLGEQRAVNIMRSGANDYLMKDNLARLAPTIERELKEAENRRQKREAEIAHHETEERLKLALEIAKMGVWELNLKTGNVIGSSEFRRLWRVGPEGRHYEDCLEPIHPEDAPQLVELVTGAIENNQRFETEFRFIAEGGEIRWLSSLGRPHFDKKGEPVKLVALVQDITEQRKSEKQLRQSIERFRSLVNATSQVVWTADADGNLLTARNLTDNESGDRDKEAEHLQWTQRIHPEDRELAIEGLKKATKNNGESEVQFRLRHRDDNEYHHYLARGVPIFRRDGTVREWIGTLTDVTQTTIAEDALRNSEMRYRALASSAQEVWTADAHGYVSNPDFNLIDISTDELPESERYWWVGRAHPEDRQEVLGTWKKAVREKKIFELEYRIMDEAGDSNALTSSGYRYFYVRAVPVLNEDGSVREWVGININIDERKKAEAELQLSEAKLQQAQKLESVGQLAGGIAHDFNNMLTAINGYSDLALRKLPENDPVRRYIEEIKKSGERSAELTHQLLAFSRKQVLHPKVLDINQVIRDTGKMLDRLIGANIELRTKLAPDIWKIKVDSGQLTQVIMNLTVNSRDAMPEGGVLTIETANVIFDEVYASLHLQAKPGKYVMMAVSDTGIGMEKDIQEQIFEPFFSTKEISKGTGLGLSTVYGIVKQSDGYIWVYSDLGHGTVFKIYLPQVEAGSGADDQADLEPVDRKGDETVLLVEDEYLVRSLCRQVLETAGYKVFEAQNGVEALELFEKNIDQVDLLMTDIVMPQMGGRTLVEKISKLKPDLPVLFMSGYTDDSVLRTGIIDNGENYLQKPFTYHTLTKKIRTLLDR